MAKIRAYPELYIRNIRLILSLTGSTEIATAMSDAAFLQCLVSAVLTTPCCLFSDTVLGCLSQNPTSYVGSNTLLDAVSKVSTVTDPPFSSVKVPSEKQMEGCSPASEYLCNCIPCLCNAIYKL